MNEYDGSTTREHDIGRAGQLPPMEAEAIAGSMEQASYSSLRLGIFSLNCSHVPTAGWCDVIEGGP